MSEYAWEGKDTDGNVVSANIKGMTLTDEFFTKPPKNEILLGKNRVWMYEDGKCRVILSYDVVMGIMAGIQRAEELNCVVSLQLAEKSD